MKERRDGEPLRRAPACKATRGRATRGAPAPGAGACAPAARRPLRSEGDSRRIRCVAFPCATHAATGQRSRRTPQTVVADRFLGVHGARRNGAGGAIRRQPGALRRGDDREARSAGESVVRPPTQRTRSAIRCTTIGLFAHPPGETEHGSAAARSVPEPRRTCDLRGAGKSSRRRPPGAACPSAQPRRVRGGCLPAPRARRAQTPVDHDWGLKPLSGRSNRPSQRDQGCVTPN